MNLTSLFGKKETPDQLYLDRLLCLNMKNVPIEDKYVIVASRFLGEAQLEKSAVIVRTPPPIMDEEGIGGVYLLYPKKNRVIGFSIKRAGYWFDKSEQVREIYLQDINGDETLLTLGSEQPTDFEIFPVNTSDRPEKNIRGIQRVLKSLRNVAIHPPLPALPDTYLKAIGALAEPPVLLE